MMHLSGLVLATTNELEQKREFDRVDDMYDTVDCLNRDKSKSNEKLYPGIECPLKNKVLKWNELLPSLQFVLPPGDDYSYVIEEYDTVDGANSDSPHFICTVRINLFTEEDANVWMIKMSEHNKCTYRTTKTVKPEQKRVKCKFAKHCQHFAKKLTPKQAEKSPVSRAIKVKAPLSSQLRNKKT